MMNAFGPFGNNTEYNSETDERKREKIRHEAILISRLRQCGIVDSTCSDPGCQQKLLLTNCVLVSRESSFSKVTRLPSRFESLYRGGLVRGSLKTFYCFIGETNCRLASLAGMRLRG